MISGYLPFAFVTKSAFRSQDLQKYCLTFVRRCSCSLYTGREEREVLGVGSIPVAILPSCQDVKNIAL